MIPPLAADAAGFVHGTSKISDPAAQGSLRLYEGIIG
jgi:hypothetical protein